jgi:Fe-Mn family superoxide dismutase
MDITAVPFTYQPGVLSRKQFDEHISLYKGYVGKTNEITKKLHGEPEHASANATWSHYRGLKKGETYAIDGVIMHELYFQNLFGGNALIGKKMSYLLERDFGGINNWRDDFHACGMAARGWCVCVYEQRTETCRNILLDLHDEGQICSAYPLVVMDMYEHAYFLDYGTDKNRYINAFIDHIAWDAAEKRAGAVVG